MADQIDLATLPCPEGCRWEYPSKPCNETKAILTFGKAYIGSLQKFTSWRPCFAMNEHPFGPWFKDASSAAAYILETLGLSPVPAPARTFTDHDLQTVAEAAYKAGMRHDPEKVAPFDYTEIVEAALTAAIGHGSKERTFTEAEMVREFHDAFGVPISDSHECPNLRRCTLRMELIDEEVAELKKAHESGRAEEIAKELADVVYVCHGMALEYGIDLGTVFRAVHRSNMSKLGPDGKPVLREDGKVLKGPNYSAPDITAALAAAKGAAR